LDRKKKQGPEVGGRRLKKKKMEAHSRTYSAHMEKPCIFLGGDAKQTQKYV